ERTRSRTPVPRTGTALHRGLPRLRPSPACPACVGSRALPLYSRSEGAAKRLPAIPPAPELAADHARLRPDRGIAGAADQLRRGDARDERDALDTTAAGDGLVPPGGLSSEVR